jgi:hypothetical protein
MQEWAMNIHVKELTAGRLKLPQFYTQGVQLKSGPYFNMSNLFTEIYNMLYYTTNLYLQ